MDGSNVTMLIGGRGDGDGGGDDGGFEQAAARIHRLLTAPGPVVGGALGSPLTGSETEGESMDKDRAGVVVYWRPGCVYCMKLRLRLRFTRLKYTKVNIWRDRDAAAFVRSVADGNETVPTVTVGGEAMVNPSKRQLMAAVERYAPHLLVG